MPPKHSGTTSPPASVRFDVVEQLLGDLLGRAPHLQVGEEAVELVDAVLVDVVGQAGVVLVALDLGEPGVVELVVLDRRAGPPLQVLRAHALGLGGVLADAGHDDEHRLGRLDALQLEEPLAVGLELGLGGVPRLLGDHHEADAHAGHDLHRLGRHRRGERAALEAGERIGPDLDRRLLVELAVVLHRARLEGVEQGVAVLLEPAARLAHRHAEADELLLAEAPTEAEDRPPAREVVEHRELLGDPHRVVPGQHGDERAQLEPGRLPGEPRQDHPLLGRELVVGEVVLGHPHRVEPGAFGAGAESELELVDGGVGGASVEVGELQAEPDVHECLLTTALCGRASSCRVTSAGGAFAATANGRRGGSFCPTVARFRGCRTGGGRRRRRGLRRPRRRTGRGR